MVRPLSSVVSAVAIILLSCHSPTTTRAFSPPDSSISRSRLNRDRRNELPSPILQYGRIKSSPRDGGAVGTRSVVVCHAGISPVAAGTSVARRFFSYGATAFMTNWKSNCLIPLVAGFVGWYVNISVHIRIFICIATAKPSRSTQLKVDELSCRANDIFPHPMAGTAYL